MTKLNDDICSVHVDDRAYLYMFTIEKNNYKLTEIKKMKFSGNVRNLEFNGRELAVSLEREVHVYGLGRDKPKGPYQVAQEAALQLPAPILYLKFVGEGLLVMTQEAIFMAGKGGWGLTELGKSGLRPDSKVCGMALNGALLQALVVVARPSKKESRQPNDVLVIEYEVKNGLIPAPGEVFDVETVVGRFMFEQSKVFFLKPDLIILSLYEEVVLLKKIFSKYHAVDNIRIKDFHVAEEGGQMAMIDSKTIIYSEASMIFVYFYEIIETTQKTYLVLSLIDNFKGNDSAIYVLYEGIGMLSTQILFYFNKQMIRHPKVGYKMVRLEPEEEGEEEGQLRFQVYGIAEVHPL